MKSIVVDYIPPEIGMPLIVILWVGFLLIVLFSLRIAKVKRDKIRRARLRAARRESFIFLQNGADEEYLESLKPHKRGVV